MNDVKTKLDVFIKRAKKEIDTHQSSLDRANKDRSVDIHYKNALSNRVEMYKIGQDLAEMLLGVLVEIEDEPKRHPQPIRQSGVIMDIDMEDEEEIFNRFRSR